MGAPTKPDYFPHTTPMTPAGYLVWKAGTPDEERYPLADALTIGRRKADEHQPGFLAIDDSAVSSRHCVIVRKQGGDFWIRDMSRNGTRLDGRRLMPNVDIELKPGQVISIGKGAYFELRDTDERTPAVSTRGEKPAHTETEVTIAPTMATVLVGDVQNFSELVQQSQPGTVQRVINHVFASLETEVVRFGGTIKEHHGDAIFAFWEKDAAERYAANACRAALALNALAKEIAEDAERWPFQDFPLRMDFALATGSVVIDSFGGSQPVGLSMVGEPVVLAFRIEKIASNSTGPIVVCSTTHELAAGSFQLNDLGEHFVKGFAKPQRLFALKGALEEH